MWGLVGFGGFSFLVCFLGFGDFGFAVAVWVLNCLCGLGAIGYLGFSFCGLWWHRFSHLVCVCVVVLMWFGALVLAAGGFGDSWWVCWFLCGGLW